MTTTQRLSSDLEDENNNPDLDLDPPFVKGHAKKGSYSSTSSSKGSHSNSSRSSASSALTVQENLEKLTLDSKEDSPTPVNSDSEGQGQEKGQRSQGQEEVMGVTTPTSESMEFLRKDEEVRRHRFQIYLYSSKGEGSSKVQISL